MASELHEFKLTTSPQAAILVELPRLFQRKEAQKMHSRLRSYLGYPSVRDALPNTTHFALAALQHTSHISQVITQVRIQVNLRKPTRTTQLQNVDGLHHKALRSSAPLYWTTSRLQDNILELHGTLHVSSAL